MGGGILNGNRFVSMLSDVDHTLVDIRRNAVRNVMLAGALAEIHEHNVLKLIDPFDGGQLLTFLYVIIDELICLFYTYAAGNGSHHPSLCYCGDKNNRNCVFFFLPDLLSCDPSAVPSGF